VSGESDFAAFLLLGAALATSLAVSFFFAALGSLFFFSLGLGAVPVSSSSAFAVDLAFRFFAAGLTLSF
jgi:hypothetical protein